MAKKLRQVHLEDKYTLTKGRVFLSGVQALVRLPLMQKQLDERHGLNTAGFISGYRGSPLGGYDMNLWKAQEHLDKHHIKFVPGVNEDLGATAVWGSQQTTLFEGATVDGVFGIWYGKGPGVDRTGDVFKHANAAGTAKYGGVLAIAGDDHTCKSSTLPHQTDQAFMANFIPVLSPSSVQDILDLGLYGWALSRYSGCWVAFKVIADTVDTSASVEVDPERIKITYPSDQDFQMPEGGLNIRWPDPPLDQEKRQQTYRLEAVKAFAKVNPINPVIWDHPQGKIGIISSGKSYLDTRQALQDLGIDAEQAQKLGVKLLKVGLVWPLVPDQIIDFCQGLDHILVIEEKQPVMESQVKDILYNLDPKKRPTVRGKRDLQGKELLRPIYELPPLAISKAIASLFEGKKHPEIHVHLGEMDTIEQGLNKVPPKLSRIPFYCSGCPHNVSTKVPEGSRALAGIGCHYMATWIHHNTFTFTQMGGEGVPWIGQAPFTKTKHVFANLGDGTYFHSGLLAIRAAVSAGVNITYKILYNDAVAMTGGQHVDGPLSVALITRQVRDEGVKTIYVVSDEPEKYPSDTNFAKGTIIAHRRALDRIQRECRDLEGTSVIVYDQTCAAEKRRRRKRGLMDDPPKRVFINQDVCEGCGDCSKKSNCLSVTPVETALGRKRVIDQSTCNKDYSCVEGFCPSFATIHGGKVRRTNTATNRDIYAVDLPDPKKPALKDPYRIFVTGVGGTGVITIGSIIGMAAHLESKGCSIVDMAGLAQKGGAVVSHIVLAPHPQDIHATRVSSGASDLLLGCDIIVAAGSDARHTLRLGKTQAIVNSFETITGAFTTNPDFDFQRDALRQDIIDSVGREAVDFIAATEIATALMGDSIATNMFMLGVAYQKGLLPIGGEALEQAIRLNDVAVDANLRAFRWGRYAAVDRKAVEDASGINKDKYHQFIPKTLAETMAHRREHLTKYQSKRYANRYEALVQRVVAAESALGLGDALSIAVAKYYAKVLAYKDEYEVARLYSDPAYEKGLRDQFEGDYKIKIYLAPPLISPMDPDTGEPRKMAFGSWIFPVFKGLSKLKVLRGTVLDPFGYLSERRLERRLITRYEENVAVILKNLTADTHGAAIELASVPEYIRGFGHVKAEHLANAQAVETRLLKMMGA